MTGTRLARLLRLEVALLRRRETRRRFDPTVYVGTLGGERDSFVVPAAEAPALDPAVRTDLLTRVLEGVAPVHRQAWLVRSGEPEPHDADAQWFAAARAAFAIHGRTLTGFYVITRYGWRDPLSGDSKQWVRLRVPEKELDAARREIGGGQSQL